MTPSEKLKPIQRIVKQREDDAARTMGVAWRSLEEEQAKLVQLRAYHQEYLMRFDAAVKKGISVAQLNEYRAFLNNLSEAVNQQERVVASRMEDHSGHKDTWKQKHSKTQAFNKVLDRYQKAEKKAADRTEQKESDDRSQRPNR